MQAGRGLRTVERVVSVQRLGVRAAMLQVNASHAWIHLDDSDDLAMHGNYNSAYVHSSVHLRR